MFHGNTMFIGNSQKESRYFNLNNIMATLCLLSSVVLNLASDKPDNDKNRKRKNISLLSDCCL